MPRIPTKFFVFVAAGAFFFVVVLPNRAEVVTRLLRDRKEKAAMQAARALVQERIRETLCRFEDACEYKSLDWKDYGFEGAKAEKAVVSVIHVFQADGARREFLFRLRGGQVSEIIHLR